MSVKPARTKDYYEILGAKEDATRSEIERLYKRKAVQHHPDRGGDEEEMKTLNEAYGILKEEGSRRTYDAERQAASGDESESMIDEEDAMPRASPAVQLDTITHQVGAAIMFLALGLVLLFIVRFQYVMFLWPLALLAVFMIFVGIVQAHSVMSLIRGRLSNTHPARRFVKLQEAVFWSVIVAGGVGVYLLLTAI